MRAFNKYATNRQQGLAPGNMKPILRNILVYGIFIGAVAAYGLLEKSTYYLQLATFVGLNTLLAVGLNMLMGYAGQISLGHAAFYGLGAYVSGMLTVHLGWSPWITLPCALFAAGAVAYIVGLPTLRLTGYYLAMGTLGFGMIVNILFREFRKFTGGPSGLPGLPELTIGSINLSHGANALFLVWGCVIVAFFICERIVNSRMGRALRAIHYSERAAAAVGVNTASAKLAIFVFAAVLAALAGFLYAHMITFISPSTFNFLASVKLVAMVVIGGMASIWGSLLGASLLTLLPDFLHIFAEYEMIVYGLILMLVMIFFPEGLFRNLVKLYERAKNR